MLTVWQWARWAGGVGASGPPGGPPLTVSVNDSVAVSETSTPASITARIQVAVFDTVTTAESVAITVSSLAAALIAYWPLDEGTGTESADASGNGHTVTFINATWDTSLQKFGAAALRYTDATVGAGMGAPFAPINLGTVHTIAFWINGWDGSDDGIVLGGDSGFYAGYIDATNIYYSAGSGNYATVAHGGGLTGSHHLAMVRNGLTVTFYKDGVSLGSNTLASSNNTDLVLLVLLSYQYSGAGGSYFQFVGTVDDVRLYDVAATAGQISALYALVPPLSVSVSESVVVAETVDVTSGLLVGLWRFETGSGLIAVDDSGHGNDGTLTNGPTWVDGRVGSGGLALDGIDDYVDIPHSSSLDIGGTAITLAAWWRYDYTSDWQCLVTKPAHAGSHASPYFNYLLGAHNDGRFRFAITTSGGGLLNAYSSSFWPTVGQWYHVAGTYDGANIKLYVDGVLADFTACAGPMWQSTAPLHIGAHATGGELAKGIVDDVRVYNRTLSAEEIAALYSAAFAAPDDLILRSQQGIPFQWLRGGIIHPDDTLADPEVKDFLLGLYAGPLGVVTALTVSVADDVTVEDAVEVPAGPLTLVLADAVAVTDAVLAAVQLGIAVSDAVTVTDVALPGAGLLAISLGESVTVTDAAAAVLGALAVHAADTVTVTDDAHVALSPVVARLSDAVTLTEGVQAAVTPQVARPVEPVTVTDAVSAKLDLLAVHADDLVTVVENVAAVTDTVRGGRSVSETITVSDETILVLSPLVARPAETIAVSDETQAAVTPARLTATETITVSDEATVTMVTVRLHVAVAESTAVSEALSAALQLGFVLVEAAAVTEQVDAALQVVRITADIGDVVLVTDETTIAGTAVGVRIEEVTVTDAVTAALTTIRLYATVADDVETLDAPQIDVFTILITVSLAETVSVSDTAAGRRTGYGVYTAIRMTDDRLMPAKAIKQSLTPITGMDALLRSGRATQTLSPVGAIDDLLQAADAKDEVLT